MAYKYASTLASTLSSGATASGVLHVNTTTASTDANLTEKDLASYTLTGGKLQVGRTLRITAVGTNGATATVKTYRIRFGATTLTINGTTGSPNGGVWTAEILITALTATTQQITLLNAFWGSATQFVTASPASETLASDITIRITGQNGTANANDCRLNTFIVKAE